MIKGSSTVTVNKGIQQSLWSEVVQQSLWSEVVQQSLWSEVVQQSLWSEVVQQSLWSEVVQQSLWSKVVQQSLWSEVVQQSLWSEVLQQSLWSEIVVKQSLGSALPHMVNLINQLQMLPSLYNMQFYCAIVTLVVLTCIWSAYLVFEYLQETPSCWSQGREV